MTGAEAPPMAMLSKVMGIPYSAHLIMQRMFLKYNRGYGYVHNGLRAQDLCATLDMFFHERVGDVKYTVGEYLYFIQALFTV